MFLKKNRWKYTHVSPQICKSLWFKCLSLFCSKWDSPLSLIIYLINKRKSVDISRWIYSWNDLSHASPCIYRQNFVSFYDLLSRFVFWVFQKFKEICFMAYGLPRQTRLTLNTHISLTNIYVSCKSAENYVSIWVTPPLH